MSFKKVVTEVVDKVEIIVGRGFAFLDAHASFVIGLEQDLLAALKNPAADFVLASVLPSQVMVQVPNIEALLTKAIAAELIGTKIEADVNAQTTLEGKLRVLITDIQATPGMNTGIVRDICIAILAAINNNALSTEVYAFYLNAKRLLAA